MLKWLRMNLAEHTSGRPSIEVVSVLRDSVGGKATLDFTSLDYAASFSSFSCVA
jgi:hypothetical protein